jgi:hypothetical protein
MNEVQGEDGALIQMETLSQVVDDNGRGLSEKDLSIIAGIVLGDMQGFR